MTVYRAVRLSDFWFRYGFAKNSMFVVLAASKEWYRLIFDFIQFRNVYAGCGKDYF